MSGTNGNGKTATKTALRIPSHGRGKLLPKGRLGNKGGTGRPPDEFKALCQNLATSADTLKAVTAILRDKSHPAFMGALKWASEHGYGKPTQTVQMAGHDGGEMAFTFRIENPGDDGNG